MSSKHSPPLTKNSKGRASLFKRFQQVISRWIARTDLPDDEAKTEDLDRSLTLEIDIEVSEPDWIRKDHFPSEVGSDWSKGKVTESDVPSTEDVRVMRVPPSLRSSITSDSLHEVDNDEDEDGTLRDVPFDDDDFSSPSIVGGTGDLLGTGSAFENAEVWEAAPTIEGASLSFRDFSEPGTSQRAATYVDKTQTVVDVRPPVDTEPPLRRPIPRDLPTLPGIPARLALPAPLALPPPPGFRPENDFLPEVEDEEEPTIEYVIEPKRKKAVNGDVLLADSKGYIHIEDPQLLLKLWNKGLKKGILMVSGGPQRPPGSYVEICFVLGCEISVTARIVVRVGPWLTLAIDDLGPIRDFVEPLLELGELGLD